MGATKNIGVAILSLINKMVVMQCEEPTRYQAQVFIMF